MISDADRRTLIALVERYGYHDVVAEVRVVAQHLRYQHSSLLVRVLVDGSGQEHAQVVACGLVAHRRVLDLDGDATELRLRQEVDAPFLAHWKALKDGSMWADALAVGSARAEAVGTDLVTGASRELAAMANPTGIVGWRRVLTGNSCDWCGPIARQRYKSAESATFGHDHCDCIIAPIYADRDPGQVINAEHVSTVASTLPVRV